MYGINRLVYCILRMEAIINWELSVCLQFYYMAPSGRELAPKATEGACVKRRFLRILFLNFRKYSCFPRLNRSCRRAPPPASREPPPGGSQGCDTAKNKLTDKSQFEVSAELPHGSLAPIPSFEIFRRVKGTLLQKGSLARPTDKPKFEIHITQKTPLRG